VLLGLSTDRDKPGLLDLPLLGGGVLSLLAGDLSFERGLSRRTVGDLSFEFSRLAAAGAEGGGGGRDSNTGDLSLSLEADGGGGGDLSFVLTSVGEGDRLLNLVSLGDLESARSGGDLLLLGGERDRERRRGGGDLDLPLSLSLSLSRAADAREIERLRRERDLGLEGGGGDRLLPRGT